MSRHERRAGKYEKESGHWIWLSIVRIRPVATRSGARFSRDAGRFGKTSRPRTWRLRGDRLNPRCTTYWDELLRLFAPRRCTLGARRSQSPEDGRDTGFRALRPPT